MNTAKTWQTASTSSNATFELAEKLGQKCKGGEVFELVSDVGGGKTTFTKGLAKGIGCTEVVGSPTFTVGRVYEAPSGVTVHHFDFYRLADPGIVALELAEVLEDTSAIVVVEWGESVEDVLPENRLHVSLQRTGEETRTITIAYPGVLAYVLEGVTQ